MLVAANETVDWLQCDLQDAFLLEQGCKEGCIGVTQDASEQCLGISLVEGYSKACVWSAPSCRPPSRR